jgi:hypothetical protein
MTLPGGSGMWEEGDTFLIPLTLKHSAGEADVIADLRVQLFRIAEALNDSAPTGAANAAAIEPDVTPQQDATEEEARPRQFP